jgi:gamma-glutamyl phosphate reductase
MEKSQINDLDSLLVRRKALAEVLGEKEKLLSSKGIYIKENLLPILISTLIKRESNENNKEWLDDAIAESISFAFALTEDTSNIKDKIMTFVKKILGMVVRGFISKK